MGKLIVRIASLLLIAAFLPTAVLAAEWNLENGSIEITATANAEGGTTQTVSQEEAAQRTATPPSPATVIKPATPSPSRRKRTPPPM